MFKPFPCPSVCSAALLIVLLGLTVAALMADEEKPRNPLVQGDKPRNPLAQPAENPLAKPVNPLAKPADAPARQASKRPELPQGWREMKNEMLGMSAQVPPGYWVRLKGGLVLTVEKLDNPEICAWIVPFRPKAQTAAPALAEGFAQWIATLDRTFQARVIEKAPDRAVVEYTGTSGKTQVEGKFNAFVTNNGSTAFIIGVSAPRGQLAQNLDTLKQVAGGFAFSIPKARWGPYVSRGGGFTMTIPQGWRIEAQDPTGKSDIDMVAYDPRRPLARAFNSAPRYCSPQFFQHPFYQIRGYRPVQGFRNAEDIVNASINQIYPGAKVKSMKPNAQWTEIGRALLKDVAGFMQGMQLGQMDISVYDCVAEAKIDNTPVAIVFICGVRTMLMANGFDIEVGMRGWGAPAEMFLNDSPVLDRVQNSYAVTEAFVRKVVEGNEQATKIIMDTNRRLREIDNEITQNRWKTQDAIAEMNYNLLTNNGGYVNEKTGRIENMDPDKEVFNSSGQRVSLEEVRNGVPRDQATVVRDAYSDDYMQGIYGRIQY